MQLVLDRLAGSPADAPVEIVERKGLGHPDSVCDALAEALSLALSRFYRERFGAILHHNVDKVLLVGGRAAPRFGGGKVLAPIEITLAGRAVCEAAGVAVPLEALAQDASERWLAAHLHALDPSAHVRVATRIRPGSADLAALFARGADAAVPLANDTSLGVGFAPLTELEAAVLEVERALSGAARAGAPFAGEDVKVMGVRRDGAIELTVACALVDRFVRDPVEYEAHRAALAERARAAARTRTARDVAVAVNAADEPAAGRLYLTVTGTSAEAGDDGEAGRGNRANGLITPYRPMTLESAAGKNPVSHVGKL